MAPQGGQPVPLCPPSTIVPSPVCLRPPQTCPQGASHLQVSESVSLMALVPSWVTCLVTGPVLRLKADSFLLSFD